MSFQEEGFWMVKGTGHINDRKTAFDNPSKIEPKRSHQWCVDAAEIDYFPNKKQAVEDVNGKSSSGISIANFTPWESNPTLHSVPDQFIGRLFGPENRSVNFAEKNTSFSVADDSNLRKKMIYGEDSSFGLPISQIKKVKVDQVKDCDSAQVSEGHNFNRQNISYLHQAYNREVEAMGQAFDKEGDVTLMGHTYNRGDARVRSLGDPRCKGDENVISVGDSFSKGETNIISFGGFPDERNIIPVGRPAGDYHPFHDQSSVQVSTAAPEKELNVSNSNAAVNASQVAKLKPESLSNNRLEFKAARKEASNSFPSNVRSLISTGMLDGVLVKYVSVAQEELRGIIKGSGYLCGCQSCDYAKVLNA